MQEAGAGPRRRVAGSGCGGGEQRDGKRKGKGKREGIAGDAWKGARWGEDEGESGEGVTGRSAGRQWEQAWQGSEALRR